MTTAKMDIVDAQVHMGPGRIDEMLAAMDATGVSAILIDEYWVATMRGDPQHRLANGASRPVSPTAELAAQLHPQRFSYLQKVTREDADVAAFIRLSRDAPGCRALRISPGMSPAEGDAFAQGGYDHIFAAAIEHQFPVFIFAPDRPRAFARLAETFPALKATIDHCGIYSNSMRTGFAGLPALSGEQQRALFGEICALSRYPNLSLKWGHASAHFETPAWPGEQLWPLLRQAIDMFGKERVMWASDHSVNQRGESWADLLYGVKACPSLSADELEWLLGKALRQWIGWAA